VGISDLIESFIRNALDEANGTAELQRGALANRFGCVPSQINYVISTRFSPEHGYIVESRRGGGGYIRIRRVQASDPKMLLMHTVNCIGDEIDYRSAVALLSNLLSSGVINNSQAVLAEAALCDNALRPVPADSKNQARASILKQILIKIM